MASELDVDVVLHHPRRFVFILRRDGTVLFRETAKISTVTELANHKTLYLFDPDEGSNQAVVCAAFTVIATSPDVKHYAEFPKYDSMNDTLWMYPWTLEELVAAHQTVEHFGPWSEQIASLVRNRFLHVGGSLRLSMATEHEYQDALRIMDKNVAYLTLDTVKLWKKSIDQEAGVPHDKAPHLFFHCFPPKAGSGQLYALGYASARSEQMILTAFQSLTTKDRQRLVSLCLDSSASSSGVGAFM